MNPYIIIAVIIAVIGAAVAGYSKGRHDEYAAQQIEIMKKINDARVVENKLQGEIDALNQNHATALDDVNSRLADALERLRQRPARLPEATRAECKGTTGRELSSADAGFLERLAARAETLRQEVIRCYAYADTIYNAQTQDAR